MKNAILLESGKFYSYLNPEKNDWTIEDIALSLSNLCRYSGQVGKFYSIAQHCYHVSYAIDQRYALDGLLHDGVEAFMVDVPTPLKVLLPDYKALEEKHEAELFSRFGLEYPMRPEVHKADREMLLAEVRDMKARNPHWDKFGAGLDVTHIPHIVPWTPQKARKMFLKRFYQLTAKKG